MVHTEHFTPRTLPSVQYTGCTQQYHSVGSPWDPLKHAENSILEAVPGNQPFLDGAARFKFIHMHCHIIYYIPT